jgi:hypothetical protein
MSWSVSQVMQTGGRLGYGFSVVAPHCEPFLTLAFKTAAEAERARAIIEAELAAVQLLVTGPNSSRSTVVNDNRKAGVPIHHVLAGADRDARAIHRPHQAAEAGLIADEQLIAHYEHAEMMARGPSSTNALTALW